MGHKELVDALRTPPEDGLPDSIYDDLSTEYDTMVSGSEENLRVRDETIAQRDSEIATLKGKNYDLLMSISNAQGETVETEDEPVVPTIDDLFVKEQ